MSTFLELTNRLLVKINEVELTDTTFVSTRGLHSAAKYAIIDSINEINQQKWEWPYHAVEHTIVLTPGRNEYSWPDRFKSVDWESFEIQPDDALEVKTKNLRQIDRDEWYKHLKARDVDAGSDGVQIPDYVFRTHGNGFGVTPSPDQAYTLKYRYYRLPVQLSLYNDQCDIPSQYDNVIIAGALKRMNLFKENATGYSIVEQEFKQGISNMYQNMIGSSAPYMYDTRVANSMMPTVSNSENYKL
jgi:hypothetical protein